MVKRRIARKPAARTAGPALPVRPKSVLDSNSVASIALGLRAVELSAAARDSMRARIMRRIEDRPPPNTTTVRAGAMQWQRINELLEVALLRRDQANNNQTVLIRMQPGAEIVGHPHDQEEECLILEGEVEVGDHRLFAGDMHIAHAGAHHPNIRSRTGALLMIRSEIPPAGFSLV